MASVKKLNVIIVGAGPAGTSCALALADSGLSVALFDKAVFPRDKVCGDAIGGRVKTVLNLIDPALERQLDLFEEKESSLGWRLVAPSGRAVEMMFTRPGYVSRRMDFDQFLAEQVKKRTSFELKEGTSITALEFLPQGVQIVTDSGEIYLADMVIGCDGAHSVVEKQTTARPLDPEFYSGAVRRYYRNIRSIQPGIIEIHLIKDFLPGYFWIFPLKNGWSNVGFGMLSKDISRRRIDLKKSLHAIIERTPELKERFSDAEPEGPVSGFGLPLGGKKVKVSGERFLLCGDAAALIDPLNGEGIGNAMLSGYYAALTVKSAFLSGDFSAKKLSEYDGLLSQKLLPELRQKQQMQKIFNRPWLIDLLVGLGAKNQWLRDYIGRKL